MDATIFNENEIKTILVNVVKELYPFYREIKPWVAIYSKDKFLNLDNEYVSLKVNYDNFGNIFIKDGKLVARGGFRAGVGVQRMLIQSNKASEPWLNHISILDNNNRAVRAAHNFATIWQLKSK